MGDSVLNKDIKAEMIAQLELACKGFASAPTDEELFMISLRFAGRMLARYRDDFALDGFPNSALTLAQIAIGYRWGRDDAATKGKFPVPFSSDQSAPFLRKERRARNLREGGA